ncbi:MAG: 30S ribosomal protein S17 [Desulfurococcaceae archaeon]|nr:30S ribosomal protein S17 [Desulfurococcaceae archaeon]
MSQAGGAFKTPRNIGIPGVKPPEKTCNDTKCPWHGHLKVRGVLIEGMVVKTRGRKTAIILHEYLHYVSKYMRYERRRRKIHVHVPPCIDIREGDRVLVAETRPLAKTIAFVVISVLGKKESSQGGA